MRRFPSPRAPIILLFGIATLGNVVQVLGRRRSNIQITGTTVGSNYLRIGSKRELVLIQGNTLFMPLHNDS